MSREEVKRILDEEKILPRSRFGQNFLVDDDVIGRIIGLIGAEQEDLILEIGPGLGALTKPMCAFYGNITAVEIDKDLATYLDNEPSVTAKIINSDYLKVKVDSYNASDVSYVVSNLPYYCMTPVMKKIFSDCNNARKMVLMTEDEAYPRIVATKNTKDYGPLAVLVSLFGVCSKEFNVPGNCFYPVPRTLSCVISLERGEEASSITPDFISFVEKCFAMRRKKLMNNLKPYYPQDVLDRVIGNKDIRAEDMESIEFSRLYRDIISMISNK
ncbi:MAG: ribosomal RNA small subunit methyltransferase A [Clostridiales bacterium]|nr:ribosomal RNA small subunit methyltransferase A [Clostridiales bacterium]